MLTNLLKGQITTDETSNKIFDLLENQLLDGKKINLDLKEVTFINVSFLERLERLVQKAKELNIEIKINNVCPSIYKVFHVARNRDILSVVG